MSEITVPKGLVNVIVDKTTIATTDVEGNLLYRGYRTVELVRKATFEEVAFLVAQGHFPSKKEESDFSATLKGNFGVTGNVKKIIGLMGEKDLMRALRSLVSLYPYKNTDDGALMLEIAAKLPELISLSYRISHGLSPLEPLQGSYVERFYHLITGKHDPAKAKLLETLMILYMEHEFNASTFALRVTASTEADPISAFTTALATLKGPLHGGANAEILDFFNGFKSVEEAEHYVDEQLAKGGKVMGFGHRIYKRLDPRAQLIKTKLKEMAGDTILVKIAEAVENRMWEKKSIPANLDFYAALYMDLLGISQDFYTSVFAAARVFGWCAHYKEQLSDNRIIRPSSQYVGPTGLEL